MLSSIRRTFLATLLLSAIPHAQGTLWTVAPDPGSADFTRPQDAIDAASEGDVIRVYPGIYDESASLGAGVISIGGKSLTVVAAPGGAVEIESTIGHALRVFGLASHQSVTIRGIDFKHPGTAGNVLVADNAGSVRFEDCEFSAPQNYNSHALGVNQCDAVVLTRCRVEHHASPGNPLWLRESKTSLYDCVLRGGDGEFSPFVGDNGGDAVILDGGSLFVHGSLLEGGDGAPGTGTPTACSPGGSGGHGVRLTGAAPLIQVVDSLVLGGSGDAASGAPCSPGDGGVAFEVLAGNVEHLDGVARNLESALAPPAGWITLTYEGKPQDLVGVLFAGGFEQQWLPGLGAELLVAPPLGFITLGTAGASGFLSSSLPIPSSALPPGADALTVRMQGIALNGAGTEAGLTSATDFVVSFIQP